MPKLSDFRITKRSVDALPIGKDAIYRDEELKGFAVRVKPSGAKIYTVRYRTDQNVDRTLTLGRHGEITADEARTTALVILGKVAKGEDPIAERNADRKAETVEDLWELYKAAVQLGIDQPARAIIQGRGGGPKRASTLNSDKGAYKRHIQPLLGQEKLKNLQPKHIAKFMSDVTTGATATFEKTGPRGFAKVTGGAGTAKRVLGLIGSMMNYAVLQGLIERTPCVGIRRAPTKRRKVRLSPEQFFALGEALRKSEDAGEPWQAIEAIWAIALTGCRKSEIAKLHVDEVDVHDRALRLRETKTGESRRPLGSAALKLLAPRLGNHEFVFYSVRAETGYYDGLANAMKRVMARVDPTVKMPHLTLHGLRHAFGSQAGDLGLGILTIKELLGHAAPSGVTEGYIHQFDSAILAAADKVSGAIYSYMTGAATALSVDPLSFKEDLDGEALAWQRTQGGQLISIQEAAVMLSVGRPTVERLIRTGHFKVTNIGTYRRLEVFEVLDYRRSNPMFARPSIASRLDVETTGDPDAHLSAEETAMVLRVGRPTVMKMIAGGELQAVKVGARFKVPVSAVIAMRSEHKGYRKDIDLEVALG